MKFIDRIIDRAVGKSLARRYQIGDEPSIVYMDASQPMTRTDMAIMQAMVIAIGTKR